MGLKKAFVSAPVLGTFDPELPIINETDASDYALGAILSQPFEDGDHPVAFYSRKLNSSELNYEIYDKELLAIVTAFQQWRHLLVGAVVRIIVWSDHRNLQWFMSSNVLNRRQSRWSLFLSELMFFD